MEQCACPIFSLAEIQAATHNFDESLVIGKGSFGKVYRGQLSDGLVAIKRLFYTPDRDIEFRKEIETVSQIRHYRLISLIGYCQEKEELILVYEYMSRGSLDNHLPRNGKTCHLTWKMCLKICIGIADGLHHLHQGIGLDKRVIHGDVKSSNVLLDENFEAKISDFGLSTIVPTNTGHSHVQHTTLKFTPAYVDPHYRSTGKLTKGSDVYSFGILLLEVLCGKKAFDQGVQECLRQRIYDRFVDIDLQAQISKECLQEFIDLSLKCLHTLPEKRPNMLQVLAGLDKLDKWQESTVSSTDFLEDNGRGYDTMETLRFFPTAEPSASDTSPCLSDWTKQERRMVAAAKMIQFAFREHMIRKTQAIQAREELLTCKAKLKVCRALFNNFTYRRRVADDIEECKQFTGRIIVLLLTIDDIEGADLMGRAAKRSMEDKLEAMYAELIAQDRGQNVVENVFATVMVALQKFREIRDLFNNLDYRCHVARDIEERQHFTGRIIVLLLTVNAIPGANLLGGAVEKFLVDKLEAMHAELEAAGPWQKGLMKTIVEEVFVEVVGAVRNSKRNKKKKKNDAAKLIQTAFREYLVRNIRQSQVCWSKLVLTYPDLAMADEELTEIRAEYAKIRSARKLKEHPKLVENIAELISYVDHIEGYNSLLRYAKLYMFKELELMINVLDLDMINKSYRELALAKEKLREIKALVNDYSYRCRMAGNQEECYQFTCKIITVIVIAQGPQAVDSAGRVVKRSIQVEVNALFEEIELWVPTYKEYIHALTEELLSKLDSQIKENIKSRRLLYVKNTRWQWSLLRGKRSNGTERWQRRVAQQIWSMFYKHGERVGLRGSGLAGRFKSPTSVQVSKPSSEKKRHRLYFR